ncbi:class I SAM-dependent methyltransferase [Bradyrhizobium diazoefficiens]|uniref:class I SAM-dependent methyltransferase n=1 Tax=Bradyrhizobium diazoefficiens TaxID=1355477 RepID=UPI00190D3808|nr:class I SAM-dependent methyltransferase [Bradyrhizobium diazoefficiens]QQO36583.1 class I SAM-dependent methyltransferase [Bradyrhizobium diazoefficiens]
MCHDESAPMNNRVVRDFWNEAACGEAAYAVGIDASNRFSSQRETRYELEPFIKPFARFEEGHEQAVLEIGVGMGADHEQWARSGPARLCGIDLTPRAVDLTRERLALAHLESELRVADGERLPFPDATFDIVYSWGVLHHSADTTQAFKEVARVLKPRGTARIMIYHKWSIVGLLLWLRYGRFSSSLASIYANHLESPGTKAYSTREATAIVEASGLRAVKMEVELSPGDLLSGATGQRHRGRLLSIARRLWPRSLLLGVARQLGLYLMIEAVRPSE